MKLILQANRATGESANWTEEKVAIVKIFNFAEFRLENLCPGGRNGSCFPSSTVFSAVSKRLKGNSISRNFIFNLVYARCQYSNCENFLFAMSAREARWVGVGARVFCHSTNSFGTIIPRYSLRNESSCLKIFFRILQHRLSSRYTSFLFFSDTEKRFQSVPFGGVNWDTWICDDDVTPASKCWPSSWNRLENFLPRRESHFTAEIWFTSVF